MLERGIAGLPLDLGGWRIRPTPSLLAEPSRPRDIIFVLWWRGRIWWGWDSEAGKAPEVRFWAGTGVPGSC